MNEQSIFLELMKRKYEEKTDILQSKESEMRERVETMELIIKNLTEKKYKIDDLDPKRKSHVCGGIQSPPQLESKETQVFNDIPQKQTRGFFREFLDKTRSILPSSSCRANPIVEQEVPVQDTTCKCKYDENALSKPTNELQGEDVQNVEKIKVLAKKEKDLTENINELWEKEKILGEILRNFKKQTDYSCVCPFGEPYMDDIVKENEDLKIKNSILKLELEDMISDIWEYLQKMELPALFELQNKKLRNKRLEEKNLALQDQIVQLQQEFESQMDELKVELSQQRVKTKETNQLNEKLREEVNGLKSKITKYEDLINEHKSGSEEMLDYIKTFFYSNLKKQEEKDVPCENDLGLLAQQISRALTDFEPCADCSALLPDLATAAKHIKELTVMVDNKFKEQEDNESETKDDNEADIGAAVDVKPDEEIKIELDLFEQDTEPMEETSPEKEIIEEEPEKTNEEDNKVPLGEINKEELIKEISENVVEQLKNLTTCICIKSEEEEKKPEEEEKKQPEKEVNTEEIPQHEEKKEAPVEEIIEEVKEEIKEEVTVEEKEPVENEVIVEEVSPKEEITPEAAEVEIMQKIELTKKKSEGVSTIANPANIPIVFDTTADLLSKTPEGVTITTIIAKSGSVEVITEGPEGIVETTMKYRQDGLLMIRTNLPNLMKKPGVDESESTESKPEEEGVSKSLERIVIGKQD